MGVRFDGRAASYWFRRMTTPFDDDVTACADAVFAHDRDRFQSVMASPVDARPLLFVLYAFNVELSRAPWASQESMIAEMRVQWWRDVGAEIAEQRSVRRHYVATPLGRLCPPKLALCIDAMADARRWDIYRDPFEDETAFDNYIDATSGGLMWMAAGALLAEGTTDGNEPNLSDEMEKTIRDFAYGVGLANYFRAIPELVSQKRIPLLDGTPAGLRELAAKGREKIRSARTERRRIGTAAYPAMLAGWQADRILAQVLNEPQRVGDGTLGLSEFRKRTSLMMNATLGRW